MSVWIVQLNLHFVCKYTAWKIVPNFTLKINVKLSGNFISCDKLLQIYVALSSMQYSNLKCKLIHDSTKSCLKLRNCGFFVNLLENFSIGHNCRLWHLAICGNKGYLGKHGQNCSTIANLLLKILNLELAIIWFGFQCGCLNTHFNIVKIIAWNLELLLVDTYFEVWAG